MSHVDTTHYMNAVLYIVTLNPKIYSSNMDLMGIILKLQRSQILEYHEFWVMKRMKLFQTSLERFILWHLRLAQTFSGNVNMVMKLICGAWDVSFINVSPGRYHFHFNWWKFYQIFQCDKLELIKMKCMADALDWSVIGTIQWARTVQDVPFCCMRQLWSLR